MMALYGGMLSNVMKILESIIKLTVHAALVEFSQQRGSNRSLHTAKGSFVIPANS